MRHPLSTALRNRWQNNRQVRANTGGRADNRSGCDGTHTPIVRVTVTSRCVEARRIVTESLFYHGNVLPTPTLDAVLGDSDACAWNKRYLFNGTLWHKILGSSTEAHEIARRLLAAGARRSIPKFT